MSESVQASNAVSVAPRQEYADAAMRIFRDSGGTKDDDAARSVAFSIISVAVHAMARRHGVAMARSLVAHFVEASFAQQELLKAQGKVRG